ncbi:hypothetical protein PV390_22905 [Streptomyces sp. ME02-6991-2A]|uniref:hypothetical protein n=1 Tax=Streptomyces TaxID=1883 RepID=UPI001008535E|nr:hypothetical protein [Streptomyces sp. ME02-6991-2A]MDX3377250.1 hypothetical protein [Streptomyces sp. ME02-6991-2A]
MQQLRGKGAVAYGGVETVVVDTGAPSGNPGKRPTAVRRRLPLVAAATATAVALIAGGVALALRGDDSSQESDYCWSLVQSPKKDDSRSLDECGAALEREMTGQEPGQPVAKELPRRPEQVRVLERVVSAYGGTGAAVMPAEIRGNMARALAHYPSDLGDILGTNVDYSAPEFSTEPNDVDVAYGEMLAFLASVAKDRAAFDVVHDSQAAQVVGSINSLTRDDFTRAPAGTPDRALGTVQEAGYVVGSLYGIHAAASAGDESDVDAQKYGWPRLEGLLRARMVQLGAREDGERAQELLKQAESTFNDAK